MTQEKTLSVTLDLDYIVGHERYDPDSGSSEGPITMLDAVVIEAARQVLDRLGHDDARLQLRQRFVAIRDEEVRERITALLEREFDQEFQPTNEFGEATGPTQTLRARIIEQARKELEVRPVDRRTGYGRTTATVLEQIIDGMVNNAVRKELAEEVAKAKEQVAAAVREQAAQVITDTITRMAGTR